MWWYRCTKKSRHWFFMRQSMPTAMIRQWIIWGERLSVCWSCRSICSRHAAARSNATDRQLAASPTFCEDNSIQATEADIHCSATYLLGTQRHSSETPWNSPATQLPPIGTRPRRRSLQQVLYCTNDNTWQLPVHSQSLREPTVHHRQWQHYSDDHNWTRCCLLRN